MKKCIFVGDDPYYKIEYFKLGDLYDYETYINNREDIRYKIHHLPKGSYTTIPLESFKLNFIDIREYNLSKLI